LAINSCYQAIQLSKELEAELDGAATINEQLTGADDTPVATIQQHIDQQHQQPGIHDSLIDTQQSAATMQFPQSQTSQQPLEPS
jgi:hypothetical protein